MNFAYRSKWFVLFFLRPRFREQIAWQPTLGAIVRAADLGSDSET